MHDRAFATAAAPHDDENLAAFDRECEMLLDHVAAVGQGEIFYGNMRICIRHSVFLFLSDFFPLPMMVNPKGLGPNPAEHSRS
jgi:hypothetical protein